MAEDITAGSALELLLPHPRVADDASVSYRAKHIRLLFSEIERLRVLVYQDSEDGMRDFHQAISRAEAAEASLAQVTKERDEALKICHLVEEWWVSEKMHEVGGAPYCIFAIREMLNHRDQA